MKGKFKYTLSAACFLLAGWGLTIPPQAVATASDAFTVNAEATESGAATNNFTAPPDLEEGGKALSSALQKLQVSGGISAGEFYASNPGPDASGNETLLTNFLFELSDGDSNHPLGFAAAVGETTAPSILSPPATTQDIDLEYASLSLQTLWDMTAEVGLLKPDAGFEDTYSYNNDNAVLGATASLQPYNASGVKLHYEANGLNLTAAYYSKRLDETEFAVNGTPADHAWEAGIGTTINEVSGRLYQYHIAGTKSLTGAVIEHSYNNIYFALNIDWWQWNHALSDQYGRRFSVGGAFYAVPEFGKFSLPVRVEYIDQGGSCMYLQNPETNKIYAATITPTYRYNQESYIRFESSYVHALKGFTDKNGEMKDNRFYLAAELGYLF